MRFVNPAHTRRHPRYLRHIRSDGIETLETKRPVRTTAERIQRSVPDNETGQSRRNQTAHR